MHVKQFRYGSDNLGYVIHGRQEALAVDAGGSDHVQEYMDAHDLTLCYTVNTHAHADHTVGTEALTRQTRAQYLQNDFLQTCGAILLEGKKIYVYHTPGHTIDSVSFHAGRFLLTGDTLFNGTVGNCFSGDLKAFYFTIKTLMAFPLKTVILPGHDYVEASMRFAKAIEPNNRKIDLYISSYDPGNVRSTLGQELSINPYLRFNEDAVVAFLTKRGMTVETEYQRWESMMMVGE